MQNTDLESLCHPIRRDEYFMGSTLVFMIDESGYDFQIWCLLQPYFDKYVEEEDAFDTGIAAEDFMRDKAIGIMEEAGYIVDLDEEFIDKA